MSGWTPLTVKVEVREKLKKLKKRFGARVSYGRVIEAMVAYCGEDGDAFEKYWKSRQNVERGKQK